MKTSFRKLGPFLTIALPALLACGDSTSAPPPALAGNYTATLWVTSSSSGQTNQLVAGSTLQINLAANGTTSGHLHVAGTGGGAPLDADMAGTWTQILNVVTFTQGADTFVRNMDFAWLLDANGVSSLAGEKVFSGTDVRIILTRAQ